MDFSDMSMLSPDTTDYEALVTGILDSSQELSIPDLYDLSDMSATGFELFANRWPAVDDDRRRKIARHMADICEENYQVDYSPFARVFIKDEMIPVRLAGLDLLWDSSNTSLIAPVLTVMENDDSDQVRAAAAATLGHYVLMAQWKELPRRIAPPIVDALLAQIDNPRTGNRVRKAALESVASAPHERVPALIEQAYADKDPSMQLSAVYAMGRTANPRWLHTILAEMESPYEEMRREAARAAGVLGRSDAVPHLEELAEDDGDIEVRLAAVHSLGQIGGEHVQRVLGRLADDEYLTDEMRYAIEEAQEQSMMLGMDFDLSLFDLDKEDLSEMADIDEDEVV